MIMFPVLYGVGVYFERGPPDDGHYSIKAVACLLFFFLNNKFLMASIVASRLDYTTRDDAILINRHRFECKLNTSHQSKNLFLSFYFLFSTHKRMRN